MQSHEEAVASGKGSVFFAVCRGKVQIKYFSFVLSLS